MILVLTIGKMKMIFFAVLFLIFLRCHVNCDGQRLKYVIGFSVILLQGQLDIYDSNNDRIQNYIIYLGEAGIKI
jgi:hypothetical protein